MSEADPKNFRLNRPLAPGSYRALERRVIFDGALIETAVDASATAAKATSADTDAAADPTPFADL